MRKIGADIFLTTGKLVVRVMSKESVKKHVVIVDLINH